MTQSRSGLGGVSVDLRERDVVVVFKHLAWGRNTGQPMITTCSSYYAQAWRASTVGFDEPSSVC